MVMMILVIAIVIAMCICSTLGISTLNQHVISKKIYCNNNNNNNNNLYSDNKNDIISSSSSSSSLSQSSLSSTFLISKASSTFLLSLSFYIMSMGNLVIPMEPANARSTPLSPLSVTDYREALGIQSPGWELARQKRTIAIKEMVDKGMIKIDTDDSGNQFLKLPWIPDKKVPYKSLSLTQRLLNEVCAGAFGEIAKDIILHPVDTAKTRRQAKKKENSDDNESKENTEFNIKDFYAGFPVVLASSIPQGGTFFFIKKSTIEAFNYIAPGAPAFISQTIPIGLAVMGYWGFRTPAEVVKTQVQTGQSPNVIDSIDVAKARNVNGIFGLWKHYPVMLWLDVPFQIINFILYGIVSDAVLQAGYETSILTRLFCGITCGMIAAGATCPVDVCKTRILARDKARQNEKFAAASETPLLEENIPKHGNANILIGSNFFDEMNMQMIDNESSAENIAVMQRPLVTALPKIENVTNIAIDNKDNDNVLNELLKIAKEEGISSLFLGIRQRLLYTGLANGIRLAAYGTSRMDLMMKSFDEL